MAYGLSYLLFWKVFPAGTLQMPAFAPTIPGALSSVYSFDESGLMLRINAPFTSFSGFKCIAISPIIGTGAAAIVDGASGLTLSKPATNANQLLQWINFGHGPNAGINQAALTMHDSNGILSNTSFGSFSNWSLIAGFSVNVPQGTPYQTAGAQALTPYASTKVNLTGFTAGLAKDYFYQWGILLAGPEVFPPFNEDTGGGATSTGVGWGAQNLTGGTTGFPHVNILLIQSNMPSYSFFQANGGNFNLSGYTGPVPLTVGVAGFPRRNTRKDPAGLVPAQSFGRHFWT